MIGNKLHCQAQHNESETSEELHYLTLNAYESTSPAGADYESTAPQESSWINKSGL